MELPIFAYKQDLLHAIEEYQTLIVIGDTGSGKTTQLPKYLLETKKYNNIVVTQPRRIACISAANRVAQEINCRVGM
jgi:pre-mRNA-splicing factor ATP-dependent RNA helicase DHX16